MSLNVMLSIVPQIWQVSLHFALYKLTYLLNYAVQEDDKWSRSSTLWSHQRTWFWLW